MAQFTKEYTYLFNKITDVVRQIDMLKCMLIEAQATAEDICLEDPGEEGQAE